MGSFAGSLKVILIESQPMFRNCFKQNAIKIIATIFLAASIFGCTPSTGIDVSKKAFDETAYQEEGTLYIYRKNSFGGMLAKMWIQMNNKDVGTLGMGQIISVGLQKGTNLIGANSDINQRSYSYLMEVKSKEPKYLVASYEKSLLIEMGFDDWIATIANNVD